jgi:ATPase subunit of ABC transporter with duplicated ATPase domains
VGAEETRRVLFHQLSFDVPAGAIVGVIGGNGTGKTHLMRVIAGDLVPHEGSVEWGTTVQLSMADQSRSGLSPTATVMDAVSDGAGVVVMGDREVDVRAFLSGFNLHDDAARKLVKSLSGGERNRAHLARVLSKPCNFLILDEPTNDLDVDTLRSLEHALAEFARRGASAMVVSHDRMFLDRLATHILHFRGNGEVEWFEGHFSAYFAHLRKTRPDLARTFLASASS